MKKQHGISDYNMFDLEMMARNFDKDTTYEITGEAMHKLIFSMISLMKEIKELEKER